MALIFGAASGDVVDHGSDASLDDLDPCSFLIWCRPTSFVDLSKMFGKNNTRRLFDLTSTGGNVALHITRDTSNCDYRTNDTPLTVDAWNFVAGIYDSGAGAGEIVNIYVGDLTTEAVESTYGVANDGSGTNTTDAADSLGIGNRLPTANLPWNGQIAIVAYCNVALSLAQCRDWQWRPRKIASAVLYSHYGFNGTGTQPDWSGNGNSGTVTSATVADHVPLGPAFGFDLGWQGEVAAAATAVGHDWLSAYTINRHIADLVRR